LQQKCKTRKLKATGTTDQLVNQLLGKEGKIIFLDERFKQQFKKFEQQIKTTSKPEADPEDFCDLEDTIKNFQATFINI
jgi:hypothetical protein